MLYNALKFLAEQLTYYFKRIDQPGGLASRPTVILQNISRFDEQNPKLDNNIIITLVNLSEEATLKNVPGAYVVGGDEVSYENPPVNLNLYLLFTVCMKSYEHALIYLSHIICFFQGKNSFTRKDCIIRDDGNDFYKIQNDGLPDDFHIILDMHSLTFEQANYLWSTLGGKQHPFVCYKVRLVRLRRTAVRETRGVIREIEINDPGSR